MPLRSIIWLFTQRVKIGKTIREANEVGKDPVAAAAEAAGGYVLAKTKMVKKEGKTIDGLYYGTLEQMCIRDRLQRT